MAEAEQPVGTEVVPGPLLLLPEVHPRILNACQAVVKADREESRISLSTEPRNPIAEPEEKVDHCTCPSIS